MMSSSLTLTSSHFAARCIARGDGLYKLDAYAPQSSYGNYYGAERSHIDLRQVRSLCRVQLAYGYRSLATPPALRYFPLGIHNLIA